RCPSPGSPARSCGSRRRRSSSSPALLRPVLACGRSRALSRPRRGSGRAGLAFRLPRDVPPYGVPEGPRDQVEVQAADGVVVRTVEEAARLLLERAEFVHRPLRPFQPELLSGGLVADELLDRLPAGARLGHALDVPELAFLVAAAQLRRQLLPQLDPALLPLEHLLSQIDGQRSHRSSTSKWNGWQTRHSPNPSSRRSPTPWVSSSSRKPSSSLSAVGSGQRKT